MSSVMLSLGIVLVGLLGRATIDKLLAIHDGAAAVALWGQITSLSDLVVGVTMHGVGTGLVVLVAQYPQADRRACLLRQSLGLGLALSGLMLLVLTVGRESLQPLTTGTLLAPAPWLVAGGVGWLLVIPGLVSGYWQGMNRQAAMLALAATLVIGMLAGAAWLPHDTLPWRLLTAQALFAVAVGVGVVVHLRRRLLPIGPDASRLWRRLRGFVPAGLAIGVLTPLSTLLMRGQLAEILSWHEVGLIQALWRVSDWAVEIMSGIMAYYFLPRLSVARDTPEFPPLLGRMALVTLLPAGVILAGVWWWQPLVMTLFYQTGFDLPPRAAGWLLIGHWVRLASWVLLYALFAQRRALAIAGGELLSLPLMVLLLWWLGPNLSLEEIGLLWLFTYLVYAAYNAWMVIPTLR